MIKVKIPSYCLDVNEDDNNNQDSSKNINENINNLILLNNTNTNNTTNVNLINGNSMPASIVLTHFCETHGPSVVFTTHTEKVLESTSTSKSTSNIDLNSLNISADNSDIDSEPISLQSLFSNDHSSNSNSNANGNGEEDEFKTYQVLLSTTSAATTQSFTSTTTPTNSTTTLPQIIPSKPSCPTCSSIPQGTGLVSKDNSSKGVYYISTHQTSNQSYYSVIRNACVRSLSCEAVPGREGPVLISSGDGHWLSYMFKINDSRARGSARWYGFLCLLNDSSCLIEYFSWLIGCFKSLAEEMKRKTNVVFEREKSQQSHSSSMMSNIYRRGTRSVPLKLFTELIEDTNFFTRLHKSFCSILSNCQFKYHLLKGNQPLLSDQYESIQYFKECLKNNSLNGIGGGGSGGDKKNKNTAVTTAATKTSTNISGFSLNLNMLSDSNMMILENSFFPKQEELITTMGQVHRIMGEDSFSILIFNVIIGNQVVIRGSSDKLVGSMVSIICLLLPKECLNVCYYSETFKEQWECNILGLNSNAVIPRHIDRDSSCIIDIDYYDKSKEPEDIDHPNRSTIEITCTGPKFQTTLGYSIELIFKQYCPSNLEIVQLKSIKEEWINKSKSFYSIKTIVENEKDKRLYSFLNIINCHFEKDMEVLMFWSVCGRKWFLQNQEKR